MKVETQIKTLLKLLSQGIFEKEHILAMAHLKHHHHRKSFWDYLSVLLGCDAREKNFSTTSPFLNTGSSIPS